MDQWLLVSDWMVFILFRNQNQSYKLVCDKETGKPKGYGFCEYPDEETALSGLRHLNGYEINGRQLRVNFAQKDKGSTDRKSCGALPNDPLTQYLATNLSIEQLNEVITSMEALLRQGDPLALQVQRECPQLANALYQVANFKQSSPSGFQNGINIQNPLILQQSSLPITSTSMNLVSQVMKRSRSEISEDGNHPSKRPKLLLAQ
ncbi:uncharacterized protein A4U43_C05F19030 [Asparagus officinalis]|uniref:RRM domain-containing protein n=1 Tax=Asparagus officinalis TaxID=4686 RepID=A0A5P1ESQ2_ASPOF|nr:cleavage stimulation factor subunit 2 tau variant-like [Asparagus officinalis]ONK69075.1 uncharacterized protein A4U43_C05F19030 [Asparagus officinalis]